MKKTMMTSAALFVVPLMSATSLNAAEQAPVIFGTDPGEAHPKYIEQQIINGGNQSQTEIANGQIVGVPQQVVIGQVVRPEHTQVIQTSDSGSFDYGYASNEVDLKRQPGFAGSAEAGPTQLLSYADVQGMGDVQTIAYQPDESATPYQQDPIYQITEDTKAPVQTVQYSQPRQPVYSVSPAEAAKGGYVRIQPGDTVYGLARRYSVKPNLIIAANNMYAPYELSVGQTIKIPGGQTADAVIYQTQYSQSQVAPRQQYTRAPQQPQATGRVYIVQQGNTLYSISRQFGLDVQTLARMNGIPAPYTLNIGQQIIIPAGGQAIRTPSIARAPIQTVPSTSWGTTTPQPGAPSPQNRNTYIDPQPAGTPYAQPTTPYQREAIAPTPDPAKTVSYGTTKTLGASRFSWPLQGKVVMGYGLGTDGRRNDGINIAAPVGTPIRSVDNGEVVYRGSDLEGYGNLLLVKHTDGWVSAYAHTDAMLVRKGERVSKGQVIAKVGTSGTVAQPQLHFELRHDLKPTDPLAALQGRNKDAIR